MSTDADGRHQRPGKSDIIVELIGGTGVAGTFVEAALKAGKPVVTANKALLATRGVELFELARQNNTCIAFEASAGGGIPIIDALCRGLVGQPHRRPPRHRQRHLQFHPHQDDPERLELRRGPRRKRRSSGFAEANPAMDVQGRDAAQKLAHPRRRWRSTCRVAESDIYVEGIDTLDAMDIQFARELGYVIKLLAIAERKNGNMLSLRVHPTLVHKDDVLADVSGSFNAISVYAHALGHALWYGRGAGRMPTASAVVADLISVAQGIQPLLFNQMNILMDTVEPAKVLPFEQLHVALLHPPLGQGSAGRAGAGHRHSRQVQHQRLGHEPARRRRERHVPVVITTHIAEEGAVQSALKEIDALPTIQRPTACIRIIDQPKEFAEV